MPTFSEMSYVDRPQTLSARRSTLDEVVEVIRDAIDR